MKKNEIKKNQNGYFFSNYFIEIMGEAVHPLSYSIIDCTSEDPKHPVNNLISTEDLTKHISEGWRCEKYF